MQKSTEESNQKNHKKTASNNSNPENNKKNSLNKSVKSKKLHNINNPKMKNIKTETKKPAKIPNAKIKTDKTKEIKQNTENELSFRLNVKDKIMTQKNLINSNFKENNISNFTINNYDKITLRQSINIKNNKKSILNKKNNINKQNQKYLNINNISTNSLFKKSKVNFISFKDTKNKGNKKVKKLFIKYFYKKVLKNVTLDNKNYNSQNNILNKSKNIYKRNSSSQINNSNSFQLNNNIVNTSINHINHSIFFQNNKQFSTLSHKDYKIKSLYKNNNNPNIKNNIIIKKFIKINNSNKLLYKVNNNLFFINHKNLGNSLKFNDSLKNNTKVNNSQNSNKSFKKNILTKMNLVQKDIDNEDNILKRIKTDKNLDSDKKLYYTNIRHKKKFLDKEDNISLNNKKSYELKQSAKLTIDINIPNNPIYLKKNRNLDKSLENKVKLYGIKEFKTSPIRLKTTFSKKKKNIIHDIKKSVKKNIENDNTNNDNTNIKKNIIRNVDDKKILSMQIETKSHYQKKIKEGKIKKANTFVKNNDINKRNLYNPLKTTKFITSNNNVCINKNIININKNNTSANNKEMNKKKKIIKNNPKIKIKDIGFIKINNIYNNKTENINININIKKEGNISKPLDDVIKAIKINNINLEEEKIENNLTKDISKSANNLIKINFFQNFSLSLLPLYKKEKILDNIINFCDYETLNKMSLLNKKYYQYMKPLIYKRIKIKIIKINDKYKNNYNKNIIKKLVLDYTPLSKLSSVMILKKYKDLLYELNEKYDEQIKKDLLRTAPNNISFQYGKENYNKLYHILSAYSNYNKNIGYVQGLNFLAAHCIRIYDKEIDAFIFLDGLIRKFKLEHLFGIKNNELDQKLNEMEKTVNKWCPEVNKHLQKIFLNYDFFTCKWMITLFSNYMNIKYLFELWDYLIIFGWKFFKGFIISVIKFNEKLILNSSLETITKIMNDILKTKEFENNFNNIINNTFYYISKENEII